MRTLEVSEETYEAIKGQLGGDSSASLEDMIGNKYFFRTVAYHLTGRVTRIIGRILELEDAAWIADSGRFMDAIKEGELLEVEPVGRAYINLESVTDFFPWNHELPKEQK